MKNPYVYIGALFAVIIGAGVFYTSRKEYSEPARQVAVSDISADPRQVGAQTSASRPDGENKRIIITLEATQVVAELSDGVTYEYWTYNNQVPGPFLRVMEGDTVEIRLSHTHDHSASLSPDYAHHSLSVDFLAQNVFADEGHGHDDGDGHATDAEEAAHTEEGHDEHSIDLHAVLGPGGGANLTRVGPNETKAFQFKAMRPGLYVYHCASPHVPTHVANGMYGLILVEPKGGLPSVDREFYIIQGELYTKGPIGDVGHQAFSKEKLFAERPEYFVFNGRLGALSNNGALTAKVGERVRIFFGVGGQLASNFHIIGEIFDNLYSEGDILSAPRKNVQTTLVPAGGAAMVEFTVEAPGTYLLVDHALTRAIDRGAVGQLIVEGDKRPEIYAPL